MADYGQPQMCKIPLKSFPNAVIEHDLVTIRLRMDWVEKDGNDPSILIYITNKYPPNGFCPRNQSSVMVNSLHHHPYSHQDACPSTHQQQHYHGSTLASYDPPNLTTINTAGDHKDISSMTTTTTVVYNSGRPQQQTPASTTAIEQIASYLKSQVSSSVPCQIGMNPFNTSHTQNPVNSNNDSHSEIDLFGPDSTFGMKDMSCVMDPHFDYPQPMDTPSPCGLSNNVNRRSVVCTCPNPIQGHTPDCAITIRNNLESNADFFSESSHESSINPMLNQEMTSFLQMPIPGVMPLPSIKELTNPSSSLFFPTYHGYRTIGDPSSNGITAILSQPPLQLDNPFTNSSNNLPPINSMSNFHEHPVDISTMFFNNPPNYLNAPTTPMPTMKRSKPNAKPPRVRKKSVKQISLPTSEQSSTPTPNNTQHTHFFDDANSPTRQLSFDPISLSSSLVLSQPETINTVQDTLQHIDSFLFDSTNNPQATSSQQSSSPVNSQVRSPVDISVLVPKSAAQMPTSVEEMIDETIDEVLNGKVTIACVCKSSKSVPTPKQNKVRLASQIRFETDESLPMIKSSMSPESQKPPPCMDDISIFTFDEQNSTPLNTPRIHSTSIDSNRLFSPPPNNISQRQTTPTKKPTSPLKRLSDPQIRIHPETPIRSIPPEELPSTNASPITSIPTVNEKPVPWTDTPMPSSTENASITSTENCDQHPVIDSSEAPDTNSKTPVIKQEKLDEEQTQVIHLHNESYANDIDERFPSEINNTLASTTTNQPLPTVPKERSSVLLLPCKTENKYIYDHFFPNFSSSSSSREDTSTARPNPSFDQKPCPVVEAYFQDGSQSKAHPSPYLDEKPDCITSMNTNDAASDNSSKSQSTSSNRITPVKSQSLKYPIRFSKQGQQTRFNPIRRPSTTKPACTRCGQTQLIDITRHEFPRQRGLVFECTRCGNNSIRSNVSADERKVRLDKVTADHFNKTSCQFCQRLFHSHNEYITHLRDDHNSDKPTQMNSGRK